MAEGVLPKGFEKSQDSSKPKKSGIDKIGISIAIGITAVALTLGIGFTDSYRAMFEEPSSVMQPDSVMQPTPNAPVPMKSLGSYVSTQGNLTDQLEFKISNGHVENMLANDLEEMLVISIDTYDDGELFVDIDTQFMGPFNDGTYLVIIDNEEFNDYEQAGTELYIPFELGTEKIEIIGSYILS